MRIVTGMMTLEVDAVRVVVEVLENKSPNPKYPVGSVIRGVSASGAKFGQHFTVLDENRNVLLKTDTVREVFL